MRSFQILFLLLLMFFLHGTTSLPLRAAVPLTMRFPFASTARGSSSSSTKDTHHDGTPASAPKTAHSNSNKQGLILPRKWTRFLYYLSAMNPFLAVFFNDYSAMKEFFPGLQTHQNIRVLARTYETLFFFAKLKPRVSFAIGACLRALQLTTAFQYVFEPSIGVGFGLNLLCLYAKSRWPATIVLGWSMTKPLWKILGACPPTGSPVPITISLKANKDAPVVTKGYRIGL